MKGHSKRSSKNSSKPSSRPREPGRREALVGTKTGRAIFRKLFHSKEGDSTPAETMDEVAAYASHVKAIQIAAPANDLKESFTMFKQLSKDVPCARCMSLVGVARVRCSTTDKGLVCEVCRKARTRCSKVKQYQVWRLGKEYQELGSKRTAEILAIKLDFDSEGRRVPNAELTRAELEKIWVLALDPAMLGLGMSTLKIAQAETTAEGSKNHIHKASTGPRSQHDDMTHIDTLAATWIHAHVNSLARRGILSQLLCKWLLEGCQESIEALESEDWAHKELLKDFLLIWPSSYLHLG